MTKGGLRAAYSSVPILSVCVCACAPAAAALALAWARLSGPGSSPLLLTFCRLVVKAKVPAQPIAGIEHGPACVNNLLRSRCRQCRFFPLIVHMHNQLSHNNIQKSVFHTCTLNGMVLLPKHHNLLREYLAACDSGRLRPSVFGRSAARKSSKAKCGRQRHSAGSPREQKLRGFQLCRNRGQYRI